MPACPLGVSQVGEHEQQAGMSLTAVRIDFQGVFAMLTSFFHLPVLDEEAGKIHAAHGIVRKSGNCLGEEFSRLYLLSSCGEKVPELIQRPQMRGIESKQGCVGASGFQAAAHLFQDIGLLKQKSD